MTYRTSRDVCQTDPRFVTVPLLAVSVISLIVGQTLNRQSQNWKRFFSITGGLGIAGVCCWHIVYPNPNSSKNHYTKTPKDSKEEESVEEETNNIETPKYEHTPLWNDPPFVPHHDLDSTDIFMIPAALLDPKTDKTIKDLHPSWSGRFRNDTDSVNLTPIEFIPGSLRIFLPSGRIECVIPLQDKWQREKRAWEETKTKWEQRPEEVKKANPLEPWNAKDFMNAVIPPQLVSKVEKWPMSQKDKVTWETHIDIDDLPQETLKKMIEPFRNSVEKLKSTAVSLASFAIPDFEHGVILDTLGTLSSFPDGEKTFFHGLVLIEDTKGDHLTIEKAFQQTFILNASQQQLQLVALSLWTLAKRLEPYPIDDLKKIPVDNTIPSEIEQCAKDLNYDLINWLQDN
ncbi:MAG: hypothetical protein JSR80_01505 [Verrucomicrobia bacterium]|nr:hypothetical protein [Verrucomicrobiota bacterium]